MHASLSKNEVYALDLLALTAASLWNRPAAANVAAAASVVAPLAVDAGAACAIQHQASEAQQVAPHTLSLQGR